MLILADLDGDWRKPLPGGVPLGHFERRWRHHVVTREGIDRTHWEMATCSALANSLTAGDLWVPASRAHRSLKVLLTPPGAVPRPAFSLGDPHAWLDERAIRLNAAFRDVARDLDKRDPALFAGEQLAFPRRQRTRRGRTK